jgi:hypothetical protein
MSEQKQTSNSDCTTCYLHAVTAIKWAPRDGRCKVARCTLPATTIIATHHPRGGIDILEACKGHCEFVLAVHANAQEVIHAPECKGGDGFDGWRPESEGV